jgi:hypothetical protein
VLAEPPEIVARLGCTIEVRAAEAT